MEDVLQCESDKIDGKPCTKQAHWKIDRGNYFTHHCTTHMVQERKRLIQLIKKAA